MEQKFSNNSILGRAKRHSRADLQVLREFCEREGSRSFTARISRSKRKNSATFFK